MAVAKKVNPAAFGMSFESGGMTVVIAGVVEDWELEVMQPAVEYRGGRFGGLVRDAAKTGGLKARAVIEIDVARMAWRGETFERRMEALIRRTPRLGVAEAPPLMVRRLQKRWVHYEI